MILKGWKEIAKHVGSAVRTVQRWEKLGMPVRRPVPGARSAVVAISEELEAWIKHSHPPTGDPTSSEAVTSPFRPFRYRVLIADDHEALLITLAAQLVDEGYDVRTARDGFEALAAMRDAVPDLLVSDLKMPNMSGFELLSVVRKRFPGMAAIAYSAEFHQVDHPGVLCDRYIEKGPKSSFQLLEVIRELLSHSPLRTQPAKSELAPAWLPRSPTGYFVLTCTNCLRSFSVMTRNAVIGKDAVAQCFHCGVDVKYHIEDSVLPIQDDLKELIVHSQNHVASSPGAIGTKRLLETRKSPRPRNKS